jgi:hypothetical protein
LWTDQGLTDVTDVITYTLAMPPPGTPGDYNNDGAVDAADYVVWRNGGPLQNETATPGSVTSEDYDQWRARFGNSAGGSASGQSANAAPEPATSLMFVVAVVLVHVRRCRPAEMTDA